MGKRQGTKRSTAKKARVGDLRAKKSKDVKGGSFIPGLNPVVTAVSSGLKSAAASPTPASSGRS